MRAIKSELNDFCNKCGACFPPREGEGICKDWEQCRAKQEREDVPDCKLN